MFWGSRLFYLLFLLLSTLVTFFMSNILSVWFMMELNFLCFVSILSFDLKQNNTNGNIYYFLIQSLGSVMMLISALNFLFFNNFFFEYIFSIFLLAKLGGAPFHFWYLKLIQKLSWFNIWLMSVWQKLIPLLIMKLMMFNFLLIFGLLGVMVGSISNLNQKKIKKILGLSSIFSLGWVLLSMLQSKIWTLFIMGYGLILIVLLNSMSKLYFYNNENLENLNFSVLFYLLFFSALLMISGIPPFIMFYMKILILFSLMEFSFLIVLILLIFSVLMIYIYLMMGFSLLTFLKDKTFFMNMYFFNIYLLNYLMYNFLFSIMLISFL